MYRAFIDSAFASVGDPVVPSATHLASFGTSDHFEAAPKVFALGSDEQGARFETDEGSWQVIVGEAKNL